MITQIIIGFLMLVYMGVVILKPRELLDILTTKLHMSEETASAVLGSSFVLAMIVMIMAAPVL